jgi:predicted GNAT family acetyltransferase
MADDAPAAAPDPVVDQDAERSRFVIRGAPEAFLAYRVHRGRLVLDHTEVPHELRGRGLSQVLAQAALEHAKAHGYRVVPICPAVQLFLARHPEYKSPLEG